MQFYNNEVLCMYTVATPVPSGLYSTGDVEGDDTDDANSSINQHKFNVISMLDIPTCSLDLSTPILPFISFINQLIIGQLNINSLRNKFEAYLEWEP